MVEFLRIHAATVLVGVSMGKDSLCTWFALTDAGIDCRPYFLYGPPGLAFQQRSLDYYEREVFGTHIVRLPHAGFINMLNTGTGLGPHQLAHVMRAGYPTQPQSDLYPLIAYAAGLDPTANDYWIALGVRAADSPVRRISIMSHGPYSLTTRQAYPIWDWTKADVLACLDAHEVKLPVDYRLWGRTFDGIDYRFTKPLAEAFPADYERLLHWFPLAQADHYRREFYGTR